MEVKVNIEETEALHWCETRSEAAFNLHLEKMNPIWALSEMPYEEYMATDHWKNKRSAKLASCRYACQICNSNDRLTVHHRTYERMGHEDLEDLTVMCRRCHGIFHGKVRGFARQTRYIHLDADHPLPPDVADATDERAEGIARNIAVMFGTW